MNTDNDSPNALATAADVLQTPVTSLSMMRTCHRVIRSGIQPVLIIEAIMSARRSLGVVDSIRRYAGWSALVFLACACPTACLGFIQFDVFLGYDGIIPEASWFPVVCEVKNDEPAFNGVVEISSSFLKDAQKTRTVVELPTGTLKRLVVPVFSTTRGYSSWDIRLLDERGKVRSEQMGLRPRKQVSAQTPILGALPRTPAGTPPIRAILPQNPELQPVAARFQVPVFPDNPLALEGMSLLYLNSEKAIDLRPSQVNAIQTWVRAGGHLVVAVEQVTDVNSLAWLKTLLPCEVSEIRTVQRHKELHEWLQTETRGEIRKPTVPRQKQGKPVLGPQISYPFAYLPADEIFEAAPMQVATGKVREGRVIVSSDGVPLLVTALKGRGRVTAMMFSPEREPFRSWQLVPTFWAKLGDVPLEWYSSSDFNQAGGGWGTDGVFGAMVETRQVHKLPLEWLLLLLVGYLVVIGPLDQYWLKRIGKPMLTWITFPCYVVFFCFLIYLIGYKLRAGDLEWNELHIVDVLADGTRSELRGHSFASIYSPSNDRYPLAGEQKYSALRGEFAGWGGVEGYERAIFNQVGDNFKAEVFVPVWSSQVYVSDWIDSVLPPLRFTLEPDSGGWKVMVENRTSRKLTNAGLVVGNEYAPLGDLPPGQTSTFTVTNASAVQLQAHVSSFGSAIQRTINTRRMVFGSEAVRIDNPQQAAVAASFISLLSVPGQNLNYLSTPGIDLTGFIQEGGAVLFAWDAGYSPVTSINRFVAKRSERNTLWRVAASAP